ncbi:hypothetical protein [Azospirillum sp. TSO35-2]|uniref:hypothetical protein n=1 Tax=Azospirillum sp. TSO35-2 TaxID=716796 RepID=UPI000D61E252|nr:hypothetical protein [Azospirillum sp. TSO35-2]PWC35885.1 hypothetical protein TSO352_11710 [Azospirillum sp. TSO35-2]
MPLPPPAKLQELARIFRDNAPPLSKLEPFSETKAKLAKYSKMLLIASAQTGLQTGVTMLSGAPTVAVSVGIGSIALFPLGAALGPWLGALAIGLKANGIFALHDLRSSAGGKGDNAYTCTCGHCVTNLTYVIDRKEANTAIMALGIFTGGLTIIVDRLNSIRKSFQKNRPKEKICVSMIDGARGGCLCAIASVMMLCGEWKQDEKADAALAAEAIAVIWSSDGHARLKSKW